MSTAPDVGRKEHEILGHALPVAIDGENDTDQFLETLSLAIRARRRAERLNQRALAARAHVSKSTVARLERGDGAVALSLLRAVLAQVRLDIVVVDEDGYQWQDGYALPADVEGAVDRAGRRLPAHLPAEFTDSLASWDFARARRPLLPAPSRWRYNRYSDDIAALVGEMAARRPEPDGVSKPGPGDATPGTD